MRIVLEVLLFAELKRLSLRDRNGTLSYFMKYNYNFIIFYIILLEFNVQENDLDTYATIIISYR